MSTEINLPALAAHLATIGKYPAECPNCELVIWSDTPVTLPQDCPECNQAPALPALAAQLTTLNDLLESAVAVIEAQAVWTLRIDGGDLGARVSFDEAQRWAGMLAAHFPQSEILIVTA